MKEPVSRLAREYVLLLRAYLVSRDEACLQRAYELGREALAEDLSILQVIGFHEEVMTSFFGKKDLPAGGERIVRLSHGFLMEVLSPFDMSQRQYQEASAALRRLNEALEAEVTRIAHTLHDEAAQLLVSADLAVDEVASGLSASLRDRLEKIRAPLRQCAEELRRLSHELKPPVLDDLGLIPALEFLAEGIAHRIGIPVIVGGDTEGRLPSAVELAVYRTVQEALSNVAKHANASQATVELHRTDFNLYCIIRDDGSGFDPAAISDRRAYRGLGLLAIGERLRAVGGTHELVTAPGRGTELVVSVPLVVSDGHTHSARR